MKKMLFAAAVFAIAAVGSAAAQVVEEKFPSYIEVSGYAERELTPDTFYLTAVITEKDSKGKLSVESQQRDMIKALQAAGIDTDTRLTMVDMSGEYFKKNNTLLKARYKLKLSSAAEVRKVCALLSDLGISNVALQSVTHSNLKAVRDEVRVEAIRNARDKAAMLAEAVDQQIGSCIRINDWSNDAATESVALYNARGMKLAANAGAELAVEEEDTMEFKPIKVTAGINARFILKTGMYETQYIKRHKE